MTIEIKGVNYTLKYTNRSLMLFEAITGKVFGMDNMTDQYIYMYSVLLANNPDMPYTFDEFIEITDEQPELFNEFIEWFSHEMLKRQQMMQDAKDKKKVQSK